MRRIWRSCCICRLFATVASLSCTCHQGSSSYQLRRRLSVNVTNLAQDNNVTSSWRLLSRLTLWLQWDKQRINLFVFARQYNCSCLCRQNPHSLMLVKCVRCIYGKSIDCRPIDGASGGPHAHVIWIRLRFRLS